MMDIYCQNLTLTEGEITLIQKSTRGQASNDDWKKHRMYRITASNFYSAAVNSVETSRKLNAMYYKSFTSAAVSHGQKYEASARELYIMLLKENGIHAEVFAHFLKNLSKINRYFSRFRFRASLSNRV